MEQEWRRCPKCGRGIAIKRDGTFRRRRKGNNRMAYLTRKNQIRLEPTPPAPDVSTFEGQRRTLCSDSRNGGFDRRLAAL
jgi:hypothetical protein